MVSRIYSTPPQCFSGRRTRRYQVTTVSIQLTLVLILILISLLVPCSPARAQGVSFGLSAGVPLTNMATADSGTIATTGRYTFGPSLRIALPRGFGLDVDLLYKRLDFGFASNPVRVTAHRLELVPLFRYAFTSASIHPFVHGGMSFNRIIAAGGSDVCTDAVAGAGEYYCIEGKTVAQLRHSHTHGFVLGTGVNFHLKVLQLSPEIRVTRWVDRNFGTQDSPLRSNLTQIELLFGLVF